MNLLGSTHQNNKTERDKLRSCQTTQRMPEHCTRADSGKVKAEPCRPRLTTVERGSEERESKENAHNMDSEELGMGRRTTLASGKARIRLRQRCQSTDPGAKSESHRWWRRTAATPSIFPAYRSPPAFFRRWVECDGGRRR